MYAAIYKCDKCCKVPCYAFRCDVGIHEIPVEEIKCPFDKELDAGWTLLGEKGVEPDEIDSMITALVL